MTILDRSTLHLESLKERLAESETMLSRVTCLADNAYASLESGDVAKSQQFIGQLINSISEHFYEEIH
ncbi:MAG: hypothetical protein ACJAUP_001153 [Cellvibrionaceae bacterium]|jgi:hypothetical protein